MSVIPDSHADLLTKNVFWHIATEGPDDEIQSSPVWGGWDGEHFMFSLTHGRQKYQNQPHTLMQSYPTLLLWNLMSNSPRTNCSYP